MQTIKTGVVVALLLAVCYGAIVALNAPEPNLPDAVLKEFDWDPDDAGLDNLLNIEMPESDALSAFGDSSSMGGDSLGGNSGAEMPKISIPSLPAFSADNANSVSLPALPGGSANQSGTSSNISLPSLSNQLPEPPYTGGSNSTPPTGLPQLPVTTDGPSVSLGGNSAASNLPASSQGNANVTPGQLVSQPQLNMDPGSPLPPLLAGAAEATASSSAPPTLPFADAKDQALALASSGKLRDALQMLSKYYDSPELNSSQHSDLVDLLDALSKEVIYSSRHLAQPAYTVVSGDTLESLAAKYQVTPELLAAVNRLGSSKALISGSQFKTLPGPFHAVVSMSRQELTLMLGDLYAGRFPVSFGKDPSPVEGNFEVVTRSRDRTYYGTGGKVLAATDNRNPYGGYWLDLGKELCIHGTPEAGSEELRDAGCISLAPLDAADVYNILGQGSRVSIVR